LGKMCEILLVAALAEQVGVAARSRTGLTFPFKEKDDVQIRVVGEFFASQLPHADNDEIRFAKRPIVFTAHRQTEARQELFSGNGDSPVEADFGQAGQLTGTFLRGHFAVQVVEGDAQELFVAEVPQSVELSFVIDRQLHQSLEVLLHGGAVLAFHGMGAGDQHIEDFRVLDQVAR